MFTLAFLLAAWLSLLGLLAGQFGLSAVGAVLFVLVAGVRHLVRPGQGPAATQAKPAGSGRPDPAGAVDPQFLRDALRLCHPDVHPPERSQLANEVTAHLTELRRRQGR